jgi:hypothetical protein
MVNAPQNSLKDLDVSLKVKTSKEKKIGIRSLVCSTSRAKKACWNFGMGIRMNVKQVNYSYEPA